MIGSSRAIRVWAWPYPVDLRRSYNGLHALVRKALGKDPMSGELFLFVNRRRTSAKVFHFDGTGLCIYMKRLSQHRFCPLWREHTDGAIELTAPELQLFLEGCRQLAYESLSPSPIY